MNQLSFTLQSLPTSGRQWDIEIPKSVFENSQQGQVDAPSRLCKDVFWKGNISRQGELFALRGMWNVELIRECVRCNVDFPMLMEGECNRYFQLESSGRKTEDSDTCEYLTSPGFIDLVDALREEVWLAWKPMVVCSKSCKGLCQQCGVNLNRHECICSQNDDAHPFAALRSIRFES